MKRQIAWIVAAVVLSAVGSACLSEPLSNDDSLLANVYELAQLTRTLKRAQAKERALKQELGEYYQRAQAYEQAHDYVKSIAEYEDILKILRKKLSTAREEYYREMLENRITEAEHRQKYVRSLAEEQLAQNKQKQAEQAKQTRLEQEQAELARLKQEQEQAEAEKQALLQKRVAQASSRRSYYVSALGSDSNNGRSPDAPFKTLEKAMEAANAGMIKTITLTGTYDTAETLEQTGTDEILITGWEDAAESEKAVVNGKIDSWGRVVSLKVRGKIRFSHITISNGLSGSMGTHITVTLDTGTLVTAAVSEISNLIMTGDATITGCTDTAVSNAYVTTSVTMSGSAKIANNKGTGVRCTTLTMSENAEISGNTDSGVYCSGTLTMSGNAAITGNAASSGGGVYCSGTLTMSGNAAITGNTASSRGGGVYYSSDRGTLTISGNAAIKGNTSKDGGGVYYSGDKSTVTISGNSVISGNTASSNGGGVYLTGTGTLEGGEVSANKAEYGGGVYVGEGAFNHKGGAIAGNHAESVGGGVYVKQGGAYNAQGGKVDGNTAGDGGANVFRQQ